MYKYFYILVLCLLAGSGEGKTGSGDSCSSADGCESNEICYGYDSGSCYCPYGFKGDDCKEPDTSLIDEKCDLPADPGVDARKFPPECSNENLPKDHEICCSTVWRQQCYIKPELKCTTTNDCKANQVCFKIDVEEYMCTCALGFGGEDCMEHKDIDERCPLPNDIIDVCESPNTEECTEPGDCPSKHICCVAPDACSTTCLPLGCENAVELKTCTDQNKLCINDDSNDGFSCLCPQGYVGTMCETALLDEQCEFPEVTGDTCLELNPTCAENKDCEGDNICCSTGCGTQCVPPDSPPRKTLDPMLLAILAMSNGGRQTPVVSPPYAPYCPPNLCSQLVCPKNVGARCQPIPGQCDVHFYDQYTNQMITQYCRCDGGVQEYSSCFANICSDIYGRPLVCRGNPNARCRVTRCGSCMAYWIDERTGQRVQCN
uniref:fibropellin-1-like n=1 Tax=Styela clava TaxID=7725 RepID=UPI00193ADA18|nr:fibropellin-1-like [Styela clava]